MWWLIPYVCVCVCLCTTGRPSPAASAGAPARAAAPAPKGERKMTPDEASSAAEGLIEEYLSVNLKEEAIRCAQEILPVELRAKVRGAACFMLVGTPSADRLVGWCVWGGNAQIVEMGIINTAEKKEEHRQKFANLLEELHKAGVLDDKLFAAGYAMHLHFSFSFLSFPSFLPFCLSIDRCSHARPSVTTVSRRCWRRWRTSSSIRPTS